MWRKEMKYYTGIGSRQIPDDITILMSSIAIKLADKEYILRSGGAKGADSAFEYGCDSIKAKKEIFYAKDCTIEAMNIASQYHNAWHLCNNYVKKLHGRNVFQILGRNLKTPSSFVICWTPDGCIHHNTRTQLTGGTGTAISIASMNKIPVFNLFNEKVKEHIITKLKI